MPAHSDKTIGVLTLVAGGILVLHAMMGFVVWATTSLAPPDSELEWTIGTMFSIAPITTLGGIVLMVSGYQISRGSYTARRCAQISIAGLFLTAVVFIVFTFDANDVGTKLNFVPENFHAIMLWAILLINIVFSCGLSALLIFLLQPPKPSTKQKPKSS